MEKYLSAFLLVLLFTISGNTFAHGHEGDSIGASQITATTHTADTAMEREMEKHQEMEAVSAFPNYHPLIVHFPIVLLIMAAIFQGLSLFVFKNEFSRGTLILLGLGLITVWFSSNIFHAHPDELTGRAKEIFETHEQMADLTWWFSLAAFVVKIGSLFFLKWKTWLERLVLILLIASAITVSIAGHHGAMLVHMEGIGPKGSHLEIHDHDD